MVCGYTEPDHEVVEQIEVERVQAPGTWERYSKCRVLPQQSWAARGQLFHAPPYVRLEFLNKDKRAVRRWIFKFEDSNVGALDECWNQLISNPDVKIPELPWDSMVEGDMGVTRVDGKITSVVMY